MESYKLAFKFFVQDASAIDGHEFVLIFHKWIQQHKVADHITVDVADYEHVHNGPGTVLVTFEANFSTDREGGDLGLLYMRKQPFNDAHTFPERLRATLRPLLEAARRLEEESSLAGKIKFRTDEFLFRIYDRLLGPATAETFTAVKPDLQSFITDLYGSAPKAMEFKPSAESLFEVRIKTSSSLSVADLIQRLSAPVAAR